MNGFALNRHMKESLATFRKEVNESADLQEKIKGGTDLVELGKENGHDFSEEDVKAAYEELQDSEEGLTEFELEAAAGAGYSITTGNRATSRFTIGKGRPALSS